MSAVTDQLVPAAEAYCTDQPATETVTLLALYNSMKSFLYVAPELPPPPYTWLMTTPLTDAGVTSADGLPAGMDGVAGAVIRSEVQATSASPNAAVRNSRLAEGRMGLEGSREPEAAGSGTRGEIVAATEATARVQLGQMFTVTSG